MTASSVSNIPKKKRWTQNTGWYLFLPIMEQAVKDKIISKVVTRDYFKKLLNDVCKAAGIKREDIGIIAGVRAELYFDGTWTSVSFDAIDELAEKGTDIVFIEKEGVPEVLTEYADKYGIAMVNTRGYLTEYGKDLMIAAKKSGANIVIMTDYDLTGINIASHSPKDMPWIGVDDTTLEYFRLNRQDGSNLVAEATNTRITGNVRKKGSGDERFRNVDLEFLKEQRIEIDAILAQVGDERFWEYIMYKLKQLYPKRNYNRAISLAEGYSKEKSDLLPQATRKLMRYIMDLIEEGTEETENAVKAEQEKVDGFLDVQKQKKKNLERLKKALSEYDNMKKLDNKILDLWESPEFSILSQEYNNDEEIDDNNPKNSAC
jgi:hypothetical protein